MSKPLVIVESPTKARTIEKFLGKDYEVRASYGHVRDLPDSAAEIPAEVKKEKWSRLGVNIEADFAPLYIIPADKKKNVNELKALLKNASELLLATDEDREGESISWHLLDVLKPKIPVKRLVFHEITKSAIQEALNNTRQIDENLVKAQETRRIIDRLFGYTVSPLLWKKMARGLSAGRVQSVAMRLLVERERERITFRSADYWDIKAKFRKAGSENPSDQFDAELTHVNSKRIAIGKDFDPNTGRLDGKSDVILLDEKSATELREKLFSDKTKVTSVDKKPFTTRPSAPFTTSTLQQEASRKLTFAARRTMQVAQQLYENGLITYMRTDSTTLSQEALSAARTLIERDFGKEYLYSEPRIYKTKVKNAQEAHEAIRPAGNDFVSPATVRERFGMEAFRLYELIWKRTVASQMKDATGIRVSVELTCADANFRAAGKVIEFPGYLRAYVEGSDDPEADLADQEKILPPLETGEIVDTVSLDALKHSTQPPARYTEGSLIKELERLGIGRPSTWATIVDLVLSRTYAFKKGTALVPTFLAMALTHLMEQYFMQLVDYEFTARLEDDLDSISRGEADNVKYLHGFYFGNGHQGLKPLVENGEKVIDPREVCGLPIGESKEGRNIEVRIGRFGPFLSDGEQRAAMPGDLAPDELNLDRATEILIGAAKGAEALGQDPVTGLPVYLKSGRFGPYVQMGVQVEDGPKPKMASLLPGLVPANVTFEIALQLLQFPKSIGAHPETKEDVIVATGRYGPYIKCGPETRSIPAEGPSPIVITLEQAVELLKQPRTRGRASSQPKTLKELGKHPTTEAAIVIKSGRYGPYVTDGNLNASLPKDQAPETLTIEQAMNLLDARAAAGGGKRRGRGGKAKTAKAPAKSKAKAKSPSKKAPKKKKPTPE